MTPSYPWHVVAPILWLTKPPPEDERSINPPAIVLRRHAILGTFRRPRFMTSDSTCTQSGTTLTELNSPIRNQEPTTLYLPNPCSSLQFPFRLLQTHRSESNLRCEGFTYTSEMASAAHVFVHNRAISFQFQTSASHVFGGSGRNTVFGPSPLATPLGYKVTKV